MIEKEKRLKQVCIGFRLVFRVLLVLTAVGTLLFAAFPDLRMHVRNVLFKAQDTASSSLSQEVEVNPTLLFEVGWIPNGFELTEDDTMLDMYYMHFEKQSENGDWGTIYIQKSMPHKIHIDTEDAEIKEIKMHGYDATLITKDIYSRVIWLNTDENCFYYVDTENVSVETMLRVAESIH